MEMAAILEWAKWLAAGVIAPLSGWLGARHAIGRSAKRRKKFLIGYLRGLPPQAKAVLVDFHVQGTHTQRGDPSAPVIELLIARGVLLRGPGAGPYHAVDCYLSIDAKFWEQMDDWCSTDPGVLVIYHQMLQERAQARE